MNSKKTTHKVTGGLLMLALMPAFAGAQVNERMSSNERMLGNFCDNVATLESKMIEGVAGRGAEFRAKKEEREAAHAAQREERLAELEARRAEADAKHAELMTTLEGSADTDEKKAAVETFQQTVESLVETRREAHDAAIEVFEEAVTAMVASVDGTTQTLESDLTDAIEAAFEAAAENCEGVDDRSEMQSLAADLRAELAAIRAGFTADREAYGLKDDLEAARTARKEAHEAAQADFMAGLEEAKAELRMAFSSTQ